MNKSKVAKKTSSEPEENDGLKEETATLKQEKPTAEEESEFIQKIQKIQQMQKQKTGEKNKKRKAASTKEVGEEGEISHEEEDDSIIMQPFRAVGITSNPGTKISVSKTNKNLIILTCVGKTFHIYSVSKAYEE